MLSLYMIGSVVMQSRMEKYFESEDDNKIVTHRSRTKKNQELYKEVSSLELEDFDMNNNMSVIGDNSNNISLDEIKDILDKKYHETPKNKSFGNTEEISTHLDLNETREYDINSILEKAKEQKEVNYGEDRLKKIRNTQYDILKSLDILDNEEEIEEKGPITPSKEIIRKKETKSESEKKLKELIDTITAKELIKEESSLNPDGELDPLDLLSDLKGDDENTRVMGMLAEELREAEKENSIALQTGMNRRLEESPAIEEPAYDNDDTTEEEASNKAENSEETTDSQTPTKKTPEEEEEEQLRKTMAIKEFDKEIEEEMQRRAMEHEHKKEKAAKKDNTSTNTFTTNTLSFTQSDFDDFIDLKEDMQITKIIVKILIVVIIIAFIIAIVVLANNYLQLGLF